MSNMLEGLKNLPETMEGIRAVLSDIYGVFTVVGDFFAWLGIYGMLLLIATMILLYLLSVVSPLEKKGNYLLALGVVSLSAYVISFPLDAYLRYLLVMVLPAVVSYLLLWSVTRLSLLWKAKKFVGTDKEAVIERLLQSSSEFQREGDTKKLKMELEMLISRL